VDFHSFLCVQKLEKPYASLIDVFYHGNFSVVVNIEVLSNALIFFVCMFFGICFVFKLLMLN